ncbi:peptide-binding protein [Desulfatitalea tepidiphila]|uniref:peptide-binding protein n=1 Tax=Desulfatitalea tepidiphila TaxID=1185843 RepID=UPI0006B4AC98|nr:peptide-binding protein [Desulfatitalea tepidiphila]
MNIRRFLIAAPTLVIIVLLASYFWAPSYEDQTRGNPDRLNQFITASIGDASMLNPVLSSDGTSSEINAFVFEGLIDRDEALHFRGRVATRWQVYEHAYFFCNEGTPTARWGKIDNRTLASELRALFLQGDPQWRHVKEVSLLEPATSEETISFKVGERERTAVVRIDAPEAIRITLGKVDQMLFERLATLLGQDYFDAFDPTAHVRTDDEIPPSELAAAARRLLPSTRHNPVIDFYLRPNVKFHDGHPLTAADVAFTYRAILNPKNFSPRLPDFEPVQSVEVIDPLTIRFVYKRLYSPALATWGMGILPAHLLDDDALRAEAIDSGKDPDAFTMRQSRFNRHPIGSGPFVFQEWKSDQFLRLERFDDYWEGPPNYHRYVMRIIPDMLTQEMEFYSGTIDNYSVLPHQVARLEKDERFQHFSGIALGYTYIGYNLRRAPFDDVRVRRALGMAIDRQEIIDYVLYGQGESITGPFAKQTDYYNDAIEPLPYDPQGALALLAEAGWTPGPDGYLQKKGRRMAFTLITNNGNPLRKAVLAIAQDAWKKIGIQVETDLLEWSVFIQKRVHELDFDALVLGWSLGIDPDLYQIWHSSQSAPYQLNFVGFNDPEADDLIIKIRQEYDHATQVAYCHRLHRIIAEAQPYTFLYVGRWTAVLDKRIVRKIMTAEGETVYKPITPTPTGSYTFHFNQWIKLPKAPVFESR